MKQKIACSARAMRGPCHTGATVEVVFSPTEIRPYCLRHGAEWSGQRMWGMDKPVVIRPLERKEIKEA
jgi:hypothetical protein